MADAAGGTAETFEAFVERRLTSLVQVVAAMSGDRHTAEDVVQNVLLRAAQRWDTVTAATSPDAYVRRMVVNEYLSWRRKWSRISPRSEVPDSRSVPDPADRHAEQQWLAGLLDTLPRRQRVALVLRYYDGLDDEAIAQALGCTAGTVRSHVSRGLARLRIDTAPTLTPTSTRTS